MTRLQDLYTQQRQSPWLDNLRRGWITSGELERWVERGVRGITSNPSIFQKAIEGNGDYDDQLRGLVADDVSVTDSYWDLVTADIRDALAILRPVYDESDGEDGYVSVEVAPSLARDTAATTEAARHLHTTIDQPNLYVKIPGTAEGLAVDPPDDRREPQHQRDPVVLGRTIRRGHRGLPLRAWRRPTVTSRPSRRWRRSSCQRVDTEVDHRLAAIGSPEALALQGKAAVANAKLAYQLFLDRFSGPRWEALAARGARVQRPLWASTSTKNPAFPDTLYVDELIGPDTVNTIPDATLEAFEDHGTLARTIDAGLDEARADLERLAEVGVDLADVTRVLEEEGVAAFSKAFDELIGSLQTKAESFGA